MPRTARVKSRSKIYHIMIRGINQQNIFADDEDDEKFTWQYKAFQYLEPYLEPYPGIRRKVCK